MVNPEMFKDAFVIPKTKVQPKPLVQKPSQPDPQVEQYRLFFLKWLSIIVGGAAVLLIVWRVILKFL